MFRTGSERLPRRLTSVSRRPMGERFEPAPPRNGQGEGLAADCLAESGQFFAPAFFRASRTSLFVSSVSG